MATYYIDPAGSDSAAGSDAAPWATVSKAFATAVAGDTVYVKPGTYSATASAVRSGTAESRITLTGQNRETCILTGGTLTLGYSYITISNLTIKSPVQVTDATATYIDDCTIFRATRPVNITRGSNCRITGCDISRGGANGHCDLSGTGHLVENNAFHHNNGFDVHRINGGVNLVFRRNTYTGIGNAADVNASSSSSWTLGPGQATITIQSGLSIEANDYLRIASTASPENYRAVFVDSYVGDQLTFTANAGTGSGTFSAWTITSESAGNHVDHFQAFTFQSEGHIIERNKFENCAGQLGNVEQFGEATLRNWTFRNNLFVNSRIQINVYAPGFKFYNNTVFNTSGTTGFRGVNATKGTGIPVTVKNNLFCRVGNTETSGPYSGTDGTADYNFMSQWEDDTAKTGYSEANGINGGYTPTQLFVDHENGDFRLKAGSPCIGAGTDLSSEGFTDDYNGDTRTTWDIGAFAYDGAPPGGSSTPSPLGNRGTRAVLAGIF